MISVLVEIPQPAHRLITDSVCKYFDITYNQLFCTKKTDLNAYRKALLFYIICNEMQVGINWISDELHICRQTVYASIKRISTQKSVYRHVSGDIERISAIYRILQKEQDEWLLHNSN